MGSPFTTLANIYSLDVLMYLHGDGIESWTNKAKLKNKLYKLCILQTTGANNLRLAALFLCSMEQNPDTPSGNPKQTEEIKNIFENGIISDIAKELTNEN